MSVSDRLRQRLRKDRPMTTISMRMPEDAIEELKEIAPKLGFSGYQPLIRAYISKGLRNDAAELARMEAVEAATLEVGEPVEEVPAPSLPAVLYLPSAEPARLRKTPEARQEHLAEKLRARLLVGSR